MTITLERFTVEDDHGKLATVFEANNDIVGACSYRGGEKAHTTGQVEGGAVLVMLHMDGEDYGVVHVQYPWGSAQPSVKTIEQALAHLTTVRDELRRLERDR